VAAAPPAKEADAEEDENPFRPPADLRAEDENVHKKRKMPTIPASTTASSVAAPKTAEQKAADAEKERNKISFSIKGRASLASAAASEKATAPLESETSPLLAKKTPAPVSPLAQNSVPKSRNYEGNTRVELPAQKALQPPTVKTELVRKKRLKARPVLSEDFAQSESVYYRKTGNESVVGSGTYGKVYKAVHVYSGRKVALKKIRMEGERDGVNDIDEVCTLAV